VRVLVAEDYRPLASSLAQVLREAGHAVDVAADGAAALSRAREVEYDLVVLDLMLPRVDGFTVLERLRRERHPAAVLILTARQDVADRVKGLDLGADDYLMKPFALEELMARVRAVVRRREGRDRDVITVGDLTIDTTARVVRRGDATIDLSAREYALLEYLARRAGEAVTREEMWEHVSDLGADLSSNVVDVHIARLRRKLERPGAPRLIRTRRGIGYSLGARG